MKKKYPKDLFLEAFFLNDIGHFYNKLEEIDLHEHLEIQDNLRMEKITNTSQVMMIGALFCGHLDLYIDYNTNKKFQLLIMFYGKDYYVFDANGEINKKVLAHIKKASR